MACFAAGHRALYKNDLLNMDVSYRKLCRQIVGPPPGTNWSLDWHEILHFWNERVAHFVALAGGISWSQSVCTHYWKFARYVSCLPSHRWVKRVLVWTPPGSRNAGRLANSWEQKLVTYCRYKNFRHWMDAAEDQHRWESHLDDFQLLPALRVNLNFVYIFCNLLTFHFFFTPVPNGARHFLAYWLDSTRLDSTHVYKRDPVRSCLLVFHNGKMFIIEPVPPLLVSTLQTHIPAL